MGITVERFEQGLTYDQFKAQMTRNQERFEANERLVTFDPEDLATFKALPQRLNVLVLAEDWCGDVIDNLPVLGRLATESGKLNVRIFLRDQNLDIMDQYLKDGQFRSIPVFVVFDHQLKELGHFIERPESVTQRRDALRRTVATQHPELGSPETPITQLPEEARAKLTELMAEGRAAMKPEDNRDVVRALRSIVEPVVA
ncbi:MAG TPA: thioredoxin family protein [Ktedonobacterales bacterium]